MKVEIEKYVPITNYPYLGITDSGCVVLFDSQNSGTCLVKGKTGNVVGCYSTSWSEHLFTTFNGKVTLRND